MNNHRTGDISQPTLRETVFWAEHGFAQFLKQLEGAFVLSFLWRRDLRVMTEHAKALGYLRFAELLKYAPNRQGAVPKTTTSALRGWRVDGIGREDFEKTRGLPAESNPPFMRPLNLNNLLGGTLYTRGYVLPPGPRFHIVTRNFRLSDSLGKKVHNIAKPYIHEIGTSIGVHLRANDRVTDISAVQVQLRKRLASSSLKSVFLASDDEAMSSFFKQQFPETRFMELTRPFSLAPSAQNLHFGVPDEFAEAQLHHAVADIFLLSRAAAFIPARKSKSQWTHLVRALRAPGAGRFWSAIRGPATLDEIRSFDQKIDNS